MISRTQVGKVRRIDLNRDAEEGDDAFTAFEPSQPGTAEIASMREDLWKRLARGLSGKQVSVLRYHFLEGLTQAEIAERLHLSPSAISLILKGLLLQLAASENKTALLTEFLDLQEDAGVEFRSEIRPVKPPATGRVERPVGPKGLYRSEIRRMASVVDAGEVRAQKDFWRRQTGWERIEVEIGVGGGAYLIKRAKALRKRVPPSGIVGIELPESMDPDGRAFRPQLEQRLGENSGLPMRVVYADASSEFGDLFAEGQVSEIYIFYPYSQTPYRANLDPAAQPVWETFFSRLAPGGTIHVVTDSANYAEALARTFEKFDGRGEVNIKMWQGDDLPVDFPSMYESPLKPDQISGVAGYLTLSKPKEDPRSQFSARSEVRKTTLGSGRVKARVRKLKGRHSRSRLSKRIQGYVVAPDFEKLYTERVDALIQASEEFAWLESERYQGIRADSESGGVLVGSSFEMIADLVHRYGKGRKKILEVGPGNGLTAFLLAELSEADVTSIEIDRDRFDYVKRFEAYMRDVKGIKYPNLRFVQGDFLQHGVRDYDLIYFFYTAPPALRRTFPYRIIRKLNREMKPSSVFIGPAMSFQGTWGRKQNQTFLAKQKRLICSETEIGPVPGVMVLTATTDTGFESLKPAELKSDLVSARSETRTPEPDGYVGRTWPLVDAAYAVDGKWIEYTGDTRQEILPGGTTLTFAAENLDRDWQREFLELRTVIAKMRHEILRILSKQYPNVVN